MLRAGPATATQDRSSVNAAGPQVRITGSVVAADEFSPVASAVIDLFAQQGLTANIPFVSVVSGRDGRYVLSQIPPGEYRLRARRIGFAPTLVNLLVTGQDDVQLSIALVRSPVRLTPVDVMTSYGVEHGSLTGSVRSGERVARILDRQLSEVAGDAREITAADVEEAVTLGTSDILRAVQMIPGMATRSDWTSELWTRGGRWDQTRVYFDDVPIFNPVHTFGLFSAINAQSVSSVRVHPGSRSAAMGEGAAGLVRIRSASGVGLDRLGWSMSLTRFQGSASLRQPLQNGKGGVMLTGRVGDLDVRHETPYRFADVTARADIAVGSATFESSLLWTRDVLDRDEDLNHLEGSAGWGNVVGRATLRVPLSNGSTFSQTLALGNTVAQALQRSANGTDAASYTFPTDNSIRLVLLRGDLEGAAPKGPRRWRFGYELRSIQTHYFGSPTAPYAFQTFRDTLRYQDGLAVASVWGEMDWTPHPLVGLRGGVRLEQMHRTDEVGPVHVSPHAGARFNLSHRLMVSLGYSRTFQSTQALEGSGAVIGPGLQVSHVWLLAGAQVPILRSDIGTLTGEYWITPDWLATASLYRRVARGMIVPDPSPGYLESRRLFTVGDNLARGIELSFRRVRGQTTGMFSYTLASSEITTPAMSFPASAERRHGFRASVRSRLNERFLRGTVHASLATRVASGAPFTRSLPCPPYCMAPDAGTTQDVFDGSAETTDPTLQISASRISGSNELPTHRGSSEWIGFPNARRAPAFWNVDAQLEWNRMFNGAQITAYLQIRNVFDRLNAVTYIRAAQDSCTTSGSVFVSVYGDCFEPGIPFRPILGVRINY